MKQATETKQNNVPFLGGGGGGGVAYTLRLRSGLSETGEPMKS